MSIRKELNMLLENKKEELLEILSELEHIQWMDWANNLMKNENISEDRKRRWNKYCVPYNELSEEVKEYDRVYARKILKEVNKYYG
ncbi:MAG: RyR domain-containing protein [bacterium]